MTPDLVIKIMLDALKVAILLAAPVLTFGLVAGLLISLLQAVTQIHEMTLAFIPKIIAVVIAIVIFFPWMLNVIIDFTKNLFTNLPTYIH
jgi:flagellar biosynthetic protein FliQ